MAAIFLDHERLETLTARINEDAEFRLTARAMNHNVHLRCGDAGTTFHVVKGRIIDARLHPFLEPHDFCISGPPDAWDKLLSGHPPPFYHHLYAAMFRHTMSIEGNLEAAFSSLAPVSRMIDLMRLEQNAGGRNGLH